MYDKDLLVDIFSQIIDAVEIIERRCSFATCEDDFIDTPEGQEKLDSICMRLIAIGESLKKVDMITDAKLLKKYPSIQWKKIKGIRDFISHHYFDLDADVIFGICKNNLSDLLLVLKMIKNDLQTKETI
jgi:uncharacterized protein with HEPN domain